jgi:hypothetical protein
MKAMELCLDDIIQKGAFLAKQRGRNLKRFSACETLAVIDICHFVYPYSRGRIIFSLAQFSAANTGIFGIYHMQAVLDSENQEWDLIGNCKECRRNAMATLSER